MSECNLVRLDFGSVAFPCPHSFAKRIVCPEKVLWVTKSGG